MLCELSRKEQPAEFRIRLRMKIHTSIPEVDLENCMRWNFRLRKASRSGHFNTPSRKPIAGKSQADLRQLMARGSAIRQMSIIRSRVHRVALFPWDWSSKFVQYEGRMRHVEDVNVRCIKWKTKKKTTLNWTRRKITASHVPTWVRVSHVALSPSHGSSSGSDAKEPALISIVLSARPTELERRAIMFILSTTFLPYDHYGETINRFTRNFSTVNFANTKCVLLCAGDSQVRFELDLWEQSCDTKMNS